MYRYLLAAVLAASPLPGASAMDTADAAETEILAVVDVFKHAIIDKDKPAFLDLFLHDRATWQPVMSDERHARARLTEPTAAKAAYSPEETPEKFIDGIVNSAANIEETFEDVRVDTDGSAASVAFDFKFLRNGKALNVGREYWLMVKTDTGWKIASVVWSRNTPPTSGQ